MIIVHLRNAYNHARLLLETDFIFIINILASNWTPDGASDDFGLRIKVMHGGSISWSVIGQLFIILVSHWLIRKTYSSFKSLIVNDHIHVSNNL